MLTHLHIENYALIRQSDIDFGSGFVAITGETGAGKSILLGALALLLGSRADAAVLADPSRKCVVEAEFDVAHLPLRQFFAEADVDYDDHLVLRREILPSAKSRAFANDTPVPAAFLKQLAPLIVDIHSQHQTLTLAESSFRLSLLDQLAPDSGASLAAYSTAFSTYSALKRELESLVSAETASRREQDYLQFQLDELESAALVADEQEALEQESALLLHAEAVREAFSLAAAAIDDDTESSVLARLRSARAALARVADFHADAPSLASRIESATIELDDVASELLHSAEAVVFSPERQQLVDERLALLYRLQQKHGVETVAALIDIRDSLRLRLHDISSLDARIHDLMEQVDHAFSALQSAADALSEARRQATDTLSANILPVLHILGMPDARFAVELTPAADYGRLGHDSVSFLFNANRGSAMHDIARIASGGELSRLMLAIKSMLTSHSLLPTIIFDEIDTGVSGDIAGAVGRVLRDMASRMQVIAITHLPQIAAMAQQHLKVYKRVEADETISRIRQLQPDERIVEVAVMLSADPPSPSALQTAAELMHLQ